MKIKIILLAAIVLAATLTIRSDNRTTAGTQPKAVAKVNYCQANTLTEEVVVSISKRHMWACQAAKQVYDAPVITGYTGYLETLTPPGTYKIADKLTDQNLTGSDQLGSWNDPIKYWMPFLTNQNGNYGFHDATWRKDSAFGNIDAGSKEASHGCVEMPLAAMKWLYDWALVGTTVIIEA